MKKLLAFSILLSGCVFQQVSSVPVNIPERDKITNDYKKAINDISVGMSKREVIFILGQPLSTEANLNKECLTYPLATSDKEYFVLLFINKKLVKYNKEQKCIDIL